MNNKQFNETNLYLLIGKYFLINKDNNDILLDNFLDYIQFKITKNITPKKFVKQLTFLSVQDIIDFMLNDAIVNPDKYL